MPAFLLLHGLKHVIWNPIQMIGYTTYQTMDMDNIRITKTPSKGVFLDKSMPQSGNQSKGVDFYIPKVFMTETNLPVAQVRRK